jgi:hypothetical protein
MDDALPFLFMRGQDGIEGRSWEGCFAWRGAVGEKDTILARELLEGYGDEAAYATDDEDLFSR